MTPISATPPASRWGVSTAATPGIRLTSALSVASWWRFAPWVASSIGESRWGGKSVFSAVSTWRALAEVGSTVASTRVKMIPEKGIPRTISIAALAIAIGAGLRITIRDSRYQNPDSVGRASRAARRGRKAGARALTRVPSAARIAARTTSARPAAISDTSAPAMPIE